LKTRRATVKPIVFLSHVHEDADCARALTDWFDINLNHAVSFFSASDPRSLPPGSDWFREIRRGLTGASLLLCLVTPNSLQREWLYFETGAGCGRDIDVVPLCWGGVRARDLTPPLSFFHGVNLPGEERRLLDTAAKAAGLTVTRSLTPLNLPPFSAGTFIWRPHP
jgi:hypothetical protein